MPQLTPAKSAPALVADFFKQIPGDIPARWDMRKTRAGKAIFDTAGDVRMGIVHALLPAIDAAYQKARAEIKKAEAPADPDKWKYDAYFSAKDKLGALHKLLAELLRAKLPFTLADADTLFGWIATLDKKHFLEFPDEPYIRLAQQLDKHPARPLSATAYKGLKAIRRHLKTIEATREARLIEVIDKITAQKPAKPPKAAPMPAVKPAAKPANAKPRSTTNNAAPSDVKAATAQAQKLVYALPATWPKFFDYTLRIEKTPAGKALLGAEPPVRTQAALLVAEWLAPAIGANGPFPGVPKAHAGQHIRLYAQSALKLLLRSKLPFTTADAERFFKTIAAGKEICSLTMPLASVVELAERLGKESLLTSAAVQHLERIRRKLEKDATVTADRNLHDRLKHLIADTTPAQKTSDKKTTVMSKEKPSSTAPDTPSSPDALAEARKLVSELPKSWPKAFEYKYPVDSTPAGRALVKAPPEVRAQAVLLLSKWMLTSPSHTALLPGTSKEDVGAGTRGYGKDMINLLLRSELPFTPPDVELLFKNIASCSEVKPWSQPLAGILTLAERLHENNQLTDTAREHLATMRRKANEDYVNADVRKVLNRFSPILDEGRLNCIAGGEAWSDRALADYNALKGKDKSAWTQLLQHAFSATSAKASPAWEKQARTLLDVVGKDAFTQRVLAWLPLVSSPRTSPWPHRWANTEQTDMLLNDGNINVLRGLAWMLPHAVTDANNADLCRALAKLCETSLKKLPGIGPRLPKLANAAVYALGQIAGEHALGQLARLKTRVTFRTTLQQIEKALDDAASRLGISKSDLEELGVPAYGFDEHGVRREVFDGVACQLKLDGRNVITTWTNDKGKVLKSPPASVKQKHGDDLKELKLAAADAEKMLTAQRDRIDSLMGIPKTWKLDDFRARYLDHPLVSQIARRLIWIADGTPVLFQGDDATDVTGKTIKLGKTAEIALWHPATQKPETIVAWRRRLEDLQLTQPFKQAHREVYLLTDAERRTETYSNRFAAHIIRQHQFAALAAQRGWRNKLRLMVDDEYPPATKDLPHFGLRAEFWVEGIGDDYGTDTLDSGAFLRLATDQVRFYRPEAAVNTAHAGGGGYTTRAASRGRDNINDPIPLTDVPPLAFSEVMRDVDLFVGVSSVGNDPTWQDGGPGGRFLNYWQSYSFGELTETAQTRKSVLERLLPRLTRLRDRASLKDRFLVVKGDLRTYKIHLGSGNILMEPTDEYLCIVPDRSTAKQSTSDVFLPFEGDNTLAIILSKAFMLADDKSITDVTITRQIKRS